MDAKKNLLIYVVEDNKIYNRLVCEYLDKQGYKNVVPFMEGREAVRKVAGGEVPAIVIQDYFLEDSNGIEVLQNIKKHSKLSEFIFLTGNENMEVAVNSIKYGAYDYIIKDNDMSLRKVANKIEKITKMLELERRNKVIRQIMVISVIVLVCIVLFALLHVLFDAFGMQK